MTNKLHEKILASITFFFYTCLSMGVSYAQVDPNTLPEVSQVVSGEAQFDQAGSTLNITASDHSIIDYSSFNIGESAAVHFFLPSLDSISLNRDLSGSISQILGTLTANGRLILINTDGFYFADTANVLAGGLIASTLDIANENFLSGNYIFGSLQDAEQHMAQIVNEGSIQTTDGGFAILIGSAIDNRGEVLAPLGTVALASGDQVTIGISQDGLISVAIDEPVSGKVYDAQGQEVADQISNSGTLAADGGVVVLKAKALEDVFHQAMNLNGVIRADSAVMRNGKIEIIATGDISVRGQMDADTVFDTDGLIRLTDDLTLSGSFTLARGDFYAGSYRLAIGGDWKILDGRFYAQTSTVELRDASRSSTINGDNVFYNFYVLTPDKKVFFEQGKTQTVLNDFTIRGIKSHLVELRSTDPNGVQWKLDPKGNVDVSYVHLGDAYNLSDELIKALPSNSFGNNTGWDTDPIWDGGGLTNNWSEGANWDTGVAPGASDTVTFNATSLKNSTVDAAFAGTIRFFIINAAYTGVISLARSLTVNQDLTLGGATLSLGTFALTVVRDFIQSSGIFNGGSGIIDINRHFTLSGGTHQASSGTTRLAGNFTHTAGGIFTHNSGIFEFDGGSSTINVATSETFNGVIFDSTGTKTISAGDTLITEGSLTLEDGTVNTGAMEARGDVVVQSEYTGGSASLKFTGANVQNFNLTGAEGAFNSNITIDKTGGSVNLASNLTMNQAGQDLIINNGTLNMNGRDLLVIDQFQINGGEFIQGSGSVTAQNDLTLSGGIYTGGTGLFNLTDDFSQTNGTFNGGSGNTTFGDVFTLSGGIFNAPTGNMFVEGNYTHTAGGTFNHQNGTVIFNTGNAAIDVAGTEIFHHLTLDSTGTKTISAGDTLRSQGNLILTNGIMNGGTLEAQGDADVGSSFDGGTTDLRFSGANNQTFDLTGAETRFDGNITVNKSGGSVALSSNLTMNQNGRSLTVEEGTFDLAGRNLSVANVGGTFVIQDGGNLQLQGSETITVNPGNPQLLAGSTVTYTGNAAVNLKNFSYSNLVIQGGGASNFSLAANLSVNQLTLTSGTLTQGIRSITANSWTQTGGTFAGGTALIDINGNFNQSGGTFTSTLGNFQLSGNFLRTGGVWNHNNGSLILDGSNQMITGSTTYNHLNKTTAVADTLTFQAGQTQTVLGTLTLKGAVANRLSLRSSILGTQWLLDAQGLRDLAHLDVQDSQHINALPINCATDCVSSGNNSGWSTLDDLAPGALPAADDGLAGFGELPESILSNIENGQENNEESEEENVAQPQNVNAQYEFLRDRINEAKNARNIGATLQLI